MWPDLLKPSTYGHNGKAQFSSPIDSFINKLINQWCTTAKICSVCFYWGWFLRHVRHSWVLGCPLDGTGWFQQTATLLEISPKLADNISQGFSYFCDILSATGHQLRPHHLVKCFTLEEPTTSWLLTTPTLHPYRSACGIDYTGEKTTYIK